GAIAEGPTWTDNGATITISLYRWRRVMPSDQLRVFQSVVSHGRVGAAATALGISQPAASQQLSRLEELSAQVRRGTGVSLTVGANSTVDVPRSGIDSRFSEKESRYRH